MKARFANHPRAGLLLFLAAYACVLAGLLPVLSLWLDEILDLMVVRSANARQLLAGVAVHTGNAPLHYIVQFWTVHLLGYSAFTGRLPAAIYSLASCAGVFVLARRLLLGRPLLAVAVFALFPLQLRYALEARPHALALCLSIWSTVAFLRLLDRPSSVLRSAVYSLCVAAGVYALPFTLFVALAHIAWVLATLGESGRPRLLLSAGGAFAVAGLAFLPWYLHSVAFWHTDPVVLQHLEMLGLRAVPMILHELVGAGYIGTALTLIGVGAGLALGFRKPRDRWFWLLYLMLPVVCALAAGSVFGYFLAARQLIFALAPLALLFTLGVEGLFPRWAKTALALAAALVVAGLVANIGFYFRPRENWRTAAAILAAEPCVIYSPPESGPLYSFFVPELANRECSPGNTPRVALAISPYALNNAFAERQRQLTDSGYVKSGEFNSAKPRVEVYELPD